MAEENLNEPNNSQGSEGQSNVTHTSKKNYEMYLLVGIVVVFLLAFGYMFMHRYSGNAIKVDGYSNVNAEQNINKATTSQNTEVTDNMKKVNVMIKTSVGDISLELYPDKAPITVANFLAYVNDKTYDGTVFHRVIPHFMIQGGGFTPDGKQKPTKAPIKLESDNGLNNDAYTIAMARTNVPNSATDQFFINTVDNSFLNKATSQDGNGYAVFGKVVSGKDVVSKIEGVSTTTKFGMQDWPVTDVKIISVSVI